MLLAEFGILKLAAATKLFTPVLPRRLCRPAVKSRRGGPVHDESRFFRRSGRLVAGSLDMGRAGTIHRSKTIKTPCLDARHWHGSDQRIVDSQ